MNILQICPYYLPHTGGIERYVFNLSRYLLSQYYSVDIVTANSPLQLSVESDDKITVYRLPLFSTILGNPITYRHSELWKVIGEYESIHIHGIYTYLALRVLLHLGFHPSQKIIVTHHGKVVYSGLLKSILTKIYELTFLRFILNRCTYAVALSESDKQHLLSLGISENKISIIPNGIDVSVFRQPSSSELQRFIDVYSLEDKKIVLFLSVISERKGIFDLILSFRDIGSEDIVLLVVGDGPERVKAESLVASLGLSHRILFTGKASFHDVLCAYSVADVYVLPSYFEGMPTTIMEALVMGCPVIASDLPCIRDNFSNDIHLVPVHDIGALSHKIMNVLNNPDTRDYSVYREKYDVQNQFLKYGDIYSNNLI